MDSSQALLNERRPKDDIVPVLPWPQTTAKARRDEPKAPSDPATVSPEPIDVTAEETCPAPGPQAPALDALRREPGLVPTQAPSAATFELMNQLDALAQDLAAKSRASSDPPSEVENVQEREEEKEKEEGGSPAALAAPEPSIRVSPRDSGFESDQFTGVRRSTGRRTAFTLGSFFLAALIGVGVAVAWQSYGVSTAKPPAEASVAAQQPGSAAQTAAATSVVPQSAPAPQTAPAAVAPELAKQLEAMAQDLALVRRNVEQLTAKQEQLAAAQQQLEQLAAKQGQLAAKQEQLAQNIAKLQTREQNVRQRISAPPPRPALVVSPRVTPEPPPAHVSSAPAPRSEPPPRSEPHPLPPLPVPP
jgi:hypothetical protein